MGPMTAYGFRHANPDGLRTYPDDYPHSKCYLLEECYRCPPNVVEMSNALIRNDQRRTRAMPPKPVGSRPPAEVYIVQHRAADYEVEAIADFVDAYLRKHPTTPAGQELVLTPRRFIGRNIRIALNSRGRTAHNYKMP
jgi:DNA helicase II / ATP-dependent DNA helicase PcrA